MRLHIPTVFLLGAMGLAGCGEAGVDVDAVGSPELASETPRSAKLPAGTTGTSPGKPASPIAVAYEMLGRPQVGQPLGVAITVRANVPVHALSAQVRTEEGLFVAPEQASFALAEMNGSEPVSRELTVTPLREGVHRLWITVQGEIDGVTQSSHVTIPVQVGAAPREPKPMGTPGSDEAGEAIISLPARED